MVVLIPQQIQADDEDESSAVVILTVNVVSEPWIFTCSAIGMGTTKATLRGWLADLGTATSAAVSFSWDMVSHAGDPTTYPNWTVPQVMTKTGLFKTRIEGLIPGITYYFRAKAVGDAESYGQELYFRTHPGYNCHSWWWWKHWHSHWKWRKNNLSVNEYQSKVVSSNNVIH